MDTFGIIHNTTIKYNVKNSKDIPFYDVLTSEQVIFFHKMAFSFAKSRGSSDEPDLVPWGLSGAKIRPRQLVIDCTV